MRRLFQLLLVATFVGTLLLGASWAAAYFAVGTLLGAPPPQMGTQHTHLALEGVRGIRGHPRAWVFSYGPTLIPGAPDVRIYVTPTGELLRTEPLDLADRLKAFHAIGY